MKDRDIIELFWQRLPQAVDAVEEAYGSQLRGLAGNLLPDPQDAAGVPERRLAWGCGTASRRQSPSPCCPMPCGWCATCA